MWRRLNLCFVCIQLICIGVHINAHPYLLKNEKCGDQAHPDFGEGPHEFQEDGCVQYLPLISASVSAILQ